MKAVGPLRAPRESCAGAGSQLGLCPRAGAVRPPPPGLRALEEARWAQRWETPARPAVGPAARLPEGGVPGPKGGVAGLQVARRRRRRLPRLPLPALAPYGSPRRNRGRPRVAAPSPCRLPKDPFGGRREDLCQMSTLFPPNQLPPPAAEDALPNPEPGRPHRPPPVQLWTVSLLIPGSDRRQPGPSRQPYPNAAAPQGSQHLRLAPQHQQDPTPVRHNHPLASTSPENRNKDIALSSSQD